MRELTMNDIKFVTGGSVPSETGGAQYLLTESDFGDGAGAPITSANNPLNPGFTNYHIGRRINKWLDSIFGG